MPVLKRCLGPLYPNSRTFQQQGKYRPTPTPDTLGKSASNSMQYKLQLLLLYKGEVSVKSKDRRFCPFQPIDKHICWTGIAVDSQKTSASNFSFESLKIYKNCAIPNMTEQPKQQMEFYLATTAPVGCLGRMGILILLRSSYPATTSLQLGTHAAGSRCKPKPTEGTTESYELAESLASDLANRLSKVADVPVAPDDGLSRFMCRSCKNKLVSVEYYRTTAKASYEKNKDTLIATSAMGSLVQVKNKRTSGPGASPHTRQCRPVAKRLTLLYSPLLEQNSLRIVQRSDKRSTSTRYDALVCELQTNETLRNTFYANVRQRYGVENSDNDWYYGVDIDRGGEIPCYGGSTSAANITWCVYVYNPQYEVKVCLNNDGITYQTEAAKELNMEKILYMTTNCYLGNCLGITAMPDYFQHAFAVCVTSDNTTSFIEILVQIGSDYLKIVNLAETQSVILGDSATLSCSVLFANTVENYVTWSRNGSRYTPIEEDPFCVGQTASSMFI
ncbi:hypothetical protein EMCRGX_G029030 [Ephydatia muelleri]